MHSLPALVASACWKRAVAPSTAFPNCWAIVLATRRRTTSPVVILPLMRIKATPSGTSPLANNSATRKTDARRGGFRGVDAGARWSSLTGLLRREERRLAANLSASREKGLTGTCCAMCGGRGSRALAGLDEAGAMSPVFLGRLPAGGQFTQLDARHGPAHSVSGGHCACLFIRGNANCQKIVPTTCTGKIKPFLQLFLANLAPSTPSVNQHPWHESLPRSLLSDAHRCVPDPRRSLPTKLS